MRLMTLNCVKIGHTVIFMTYLDSVIFLIYLPKILICNKIKFRLLNLLNLAELVVNELPKNIFKRVTNIHFSIQFITA